MTAYHFVAFDDTTFNATRDAWIKDGKLSQFPSKAARLMAWVECCRRDGGPSHYGLFEKGNDVAVGICEVVESRKSKSTHWVKMMEVHIAPALEERVYKGDVDAMKAQIEVFSSSVVGTWRVKTTKDASTLKIYGRSNEQRQLLQGLVPQLEKRVKNHVYRMDGRWLVIENG